MQYLQTVNFHCFFKCYWYLIDFNTLQKYSRKTGEPKAALMSSALLTLFWRLRQADSQTGKAAAHFGEGGREMEVLFAQRRLISE